ncbi:MAG: polysaccharide deacetylase family protein [Woeseiaceae bacterium]
MTDFILGPCIRSIQTNEKTIYLTFDDGPNSYCTPQVLDLLKKYNAQATFFIISNKIDENIIVFNRIKDEGHAIGNHSLDHKTINYFKGKKSLKKWIEDGETKISTLMGKSSVGFRPPAGIRTPELRLIMKEINAKPIMWQHRFYDGVFNFNDKSWERKFNKIKCGDIILLHDRHDKNTLFIVHLENFIKQLISEGFQLKKIRI